MTAKIKALQDFVRTAINGPTPLAYTREFQMLCTHWRDEIMQVMPDLPDLPDMSDIEKARADLFDYQQKMFAEIHERRQAIRAEIEALTTAKKTFDKAFNAAFKP